LKLLLIESGGKIRKLKSILGSEWQIKATMGHIVELANDGEDSLGFTLDGDRNQIDCRYIPRGTRGKQILKELREAVKYASEILIATDADREGETIGWHLAQQLHLKNPRRVVYTEITERAVKQAIAHPRSLDLNLVAAGRCRDTLDKLVGYKGSPLLWKLGNGAKSMGRVQSAALHILAAREREIVAFVPQDYWSVFVDYAEGFRAYYAGSTASQDAKAAEVDAKDDAADAKEKKVESVRVLSQEEALQLVAIARANAHHVAKLDTTTTTRKPPAPFTTSSMQQAAGSRLKYGSEKTMKVAQTLYEQGHITYMRTDSVALSDDYCSQARQWLERHDPQNVPARVAVQKSSSGAQEAHEAIRPTHVENTPDSLGTLSDEEAKLYSLIWHRAIASQCKPAQLQKTLIVTQSGTVFWQARGQVVKFQGYTTYWNDISKDSQLPLVQQQQTLTLKQADSEKKQTQPPPRYSEPKLVQAMEKRGIGRPSTYAPTVKVLRERNYASLVKGHLQPTQLGLEVDEFLGRTLPELLESEFTAAMEGALDDVAAGKQNWEKYLLNWNQTYFAPAIAAAYKSLGTSQRARSPLSTESSVGDSSHQPQRGTHKRRSQGTTQVLTEIHCPKCEWLMQKILSGSKKLTADHFLKCSNKACNTAMFWSDKQQTYELPYSKHQESPQRSKKNVASTTEFPCPKCGKPLELYEYTKENEQKQMLRCSDPLKRRQDDHKDVAYFASKGIFWSPTYGEISQSDSAQKSAKAGAKTKSSQSSKTKKQSATQPCPVCSQPLELYEYTKGNEKKQMLRCSDAQARRRDDHKDVAYFASRGVFWSAKYGEIGKVDKQKG